MAPEVISLLSSPSDSAPTISRPTNRAPPPSKKTQAPSRALIYDDDDFSEVVSPYSGSRSTKYLISESQKRAEGIHDGAPTASNVDKRHKNGNDFLFLSDDFDSTGDFSFDASTKNAASSGAVLNKGSLNNSRGLARTLSAAVATKTSGPLQPAGLKRWNSVADPIQNTSSPGGQNLEPDPFASSSPRRISPKGKQVERATRSEDIPVNKYRMSAAPEKASANVFDLTSDFSDLSPVQPRANPGKQKANWDPISSSMPEMSMARQTNDATASSPGRPTKRKADVIELDDSGSCESEDEFPELGQVRVDPSRSPRSLSDSPRILKRSKAEPAKTIAKKAAPKTQEEKDFEKKQKTEARAAENERKRLAKENEKKAKAVQREKDKALAEVNKVRVNKAVAQVEMIVDIPDSLAVGTKTQVKALLNDLGIDHSTWNSPVDHVVLWRRKVDKQYSEEKDYFEPIPVPRLEQEKHVLVAMQALDFVQLATGNDGQDVASHVLKMKVTFPESSIIYLIEGLDQWARKIKTARNRQFQNAARNDTNATAAQARRRNNAPLEIVDEEVVEDALLSLQVDHGVFIHKTNAAVETAQWITIFTQHISTIPYRKRRDDVSRDAGFSVETGQVKTGETVKETYINMLQEVARVTAPMAYGIAARYPSVMELVRGLEENGPLALEELRKSSNRDGTLTDQRLGPAISKRVYKIFTCRDPASTEI